MAAIFVNALNEKLGAEFMVMNPIGLIEMMDMIGRIEAKNQIVRPIHLKTLKTFTHSNQRVSPEPFHGL